MMQVRGLNASTRMKLFPQYAGIVGSPNSTGLRVAFMSKVDPSIVRAAVKSIDKDFNLLANLARDVDGLYVSSPEVRSSLNDKDSTSVTLKEQTRLRGPNHELRRHGICARGQTC